MKRIYRKKIWFRELVEPDVLQFMNLGFHFEIYRWLVKQGQSYHGVMELLSKKPTCKGFGHPEPFKFDELNSTWTIEEELKRRFEYALLSRMASEEAIRWRLDNKIFIDNSKMIGGLRCHDNNGNIAESELFNTIKDIVQGKRVLNWSPNDRNEDAIYIKRGELAVRPDYYMLKLIYSTGFEESHGWDLKIVSRRDETFFDFLNRVYKLLQRDTHEYKENKVFGRLRKIAPQLA